MFLLCVTRQGVAGKIVAPSVREYDVGDWVVTVASDDWLSFSSRADGRIAVREAAPFTRGDAAAADHAMTFAAASYSGNTGAIEIYRSLIGGRQVYYRAAPDGSFYCASHARLLRAAGVRLEDDAGRMAELFVYRYVSPPRTLFNGVDQLLAGQRLTFEHAGDGWRQVRAEVYSPPPTAPARQHTSERPHAEATGAALRDAVLALSPARDRLHVLASGGLDSSILFRFAQRDLGISESHSTSYPFETEADDVEKRYALTAADAMGAKHEFFVPTARQFVRGFIEAVSIAEEPIVHTQSVLMLLLLRVGLPRGEGTVVVGQGADGAFGLRIHQEVEKVDRFRRRRPLLARLLHPSLFAAVRPLLEFDLTSRFIRRHLSRLGRDQGVLDVLHKRWGRRVPLSDHRHVLWWLGATGYERWACRRFGAAPEEVFSSRAAAINAYRDRPVLDLISLLDFLSDVSTTQSIWSKFGESARKVVYYPFNAPPLLDAAFEAPWEVKLAEPKAVLRDVARMIGVPEFVVSRPKANFNSNPDRWAVPGALFESLVPLAAKVFGEKEVRRMQLPKSRGAFTFWTMLNYAVWKRLFIDGETVSALLAEVGQTPADEEILDPVLAAGN